ncbi:DUF1917-domain-containing protein [Xylona heveae TC161]|uniref:DUF1917-domain-containing protein n=1 Tax=Xylona heveae (strain CBS 132557 / TC161) TaxID=1328760 RepID=A0A165G762_XYLHT|nr:DUF1917-domain-containing protein [Xylona heveae TC161]KZF21820.1 DUF1917-domain-containing protein [Xylona heveae TC161]
MEDIVMADVDDTVIVQRGLDDDMDISDDVSFHGDNREKLRLNALGALAGKNCAPPYPQASTYPGTPFSESVKFNTTYRSQNQNQTQPLYNPHERKLSGRKLSETVEEFLARLPPSSTQSSTHSPWIWIANPYAAHRPVAEDLAGLMSAGESILSKWAGKKATIENELQKEGKMVAAISRTINIEKKSVEEELQNLAKEKKSTIGKWMLFPETSIDRIWAIVATATAAGQLGIDAKIATADGGTGGIASTTRPRLICIYTYDFSDTQDVLRVLLRLVELELVGNSGGRGDGGIYYKSDAYTYLGITSGNPWGLKASMYSSRDMLASAQVRRRNENLWGGV